MAQLCDSRALWGQAAWPTKGVWTPPLGVSTPSQLPHSCGLADSPIQLARAGHTPQGCGTWGQSPIKLGQPLLPGFVVSCP